MSVTDTKKVGTSGTTTTQKTAKPAARTPEGWLSWIMYISMVLGVDPEKLYQKPDDFEGTDIEWIISIAPARPDKSFIEALNEANEMYASAMGWSLEEIEKIGRQRTQFFEEDDPAIRELGQRYRKFSDAYQGYLADPEQGVPISIGGKRIVTGKPYARTRWESGIEGLSREAEQLDKSIRHRQSYLGGRLGDVGMQDALRRELVPHESGLWIQEGLRKLTDPMPWESLRYGLPSSTSVTSGTREGKFETDKPWWEVGAKILETGYEGVQRIDDLLDWLKNL